MEHSLMLTTLSGETFQVSLSVAKFDRFEDLEDQVMDCLASVTDLKVFGCSIEFLQTATHTYLEDPIWDKLQQGREFTIVSFTSYEPRRNRPRMGLCRGSASATRQCRVRHQAHWCRGLAKLPTASHCQAAGHC